MNIWAKRSLRKRKSRGDYRSVKDSIEQDAKNPNSGRSLKRKTIANDAHKSKSSKDVDMNLIRN